MYLWIDSMTRRLLIFMFVVIVALFGANYAAIYIQKRNIKSAVEMAKEKLKEVHVDFNYEKIDFSTTTAFDIKAAIINPSFEQKTSVSSTVRTLDSINITVKPFSKELYLTTTSKIREVTTTSGVQISDLFYFFKAPRIDIKFLDSISDVFKNSSAQKTSIITRIKEIRYIDEGLTTADEMVDGKFFVQYDGAALNVINRRENTSIKDKVEDIKDEPHEIMNFAIDGTVASCKYNSDHPDPEVKHMAEAGKSIVSLDVNYIVGALDLSKDSEGTGDKKLCQYIEFKKLHLINDIFSVSISGRAGFNFSEKRPMIEGEISINEMPAFVKFYSKLFNLIIDREIKNTSVAGGALRDDQVSDVISLLEKLAESTSVPGKAEFRVTSTSDDSHYDIRISGKPAIEVFNELKGIFIRDPAAVIGAPTIDE